MLTELSVKSNLNFNSLDWKLDFLSTHEYVFNQFSLISEVINTSAMKFKKMFDHYLIEFFIFNMNLHQQICQFSRQYNAEDNWSFNERSFNLKHELFSCVHSLEIKWVLEMIKQSQCWHCSVINCKKAWNVFSIIMWYSSKLIFIEWSTIYVIILKICNHELCKSIQWSMIYDIRKKSRWCSKHKFKWKIIVKNIYSSVYLLNSWSLFSFSMWNINFLSHCCYWLYIAQMFSEVFNV